MDEQGRGSLLNSQERISLVSYLVTWITVGIARLVKCLVCHAVTLPDWR
jgi:hypothetical protein